MCKWLTVFSVMWLVAFRVWAIDTGPTEVTAVNMSSDSVVEVTINTLLQPACDEKLMFNYTMNTLSDVYYTLLMTAKSVRLEVDLGYIENTSAGYCELQRVELINNNG